MVCMGISFLLQGLYKDVKAMNELKRRHRLVITGSSPKSTGQSTTDLGFTRTQLQFIYQVYRNTVEPLIMDTLKSGQPPYNCSPLLMYCPYISTSEEMDKALVPSVCIIRRFYCTHKQSKDKV